jgi:hypothetical protein
VLKTRLTLAPGANGTKKLVERYGDRLVCVRYRYDAERRKRIKTVELIEEEVEWAPPGVLYLVQIEWQETALREKAKSLGARWNAARRLWTMPRETVRALSAEDRIRAWLEPE